MESYLDYRYAIQTCLPPCLPLLCNCLMVPLNSWRPLNSQSVLSRLYTRLCVFLALSLTLSCALRALPSYYIWWIKGLACFILILRFNWTLTQPTLRYVRVAKRLSPAPWNFVSILSTHSCASISNFMPIAQGIRSLFAGVVPTIEATRFAPSAASGIRCAIF